AESLCVSNEPAGGCCGPRIGCRRSFRVVGEGQRAAAVSAGDSYATEESDAYAPATSKGKLSNLTDSFPVRLRLTSALRRPILLSSRRCSQSILRVRLLHADRVLTDDTSSSVGRTSPAAQSATTSRGQ